MDPYGLTIDDVITLLEEDPSYLKYIKEGELGKSLGRAASTNTQNTSGNCTTGVENNFSRAIGVGGLTPIIHYANDAGPRSGCNVWRRCEQDGRFFTLTYHTAETMEVANNSPIGTTFSWENQDYQEDRNLTSLKPGGFRYGHTTTKSDKYAIGFWGHSDHAESAETIYRTVFVNGKTVNGQKTPRYGTLMYASIGKDVTFGEEILKEAQRRKNEKTNELTEIPEATLAEKQVKRASTKQVEDFILKNPRIAYLLLKQHDSSLPQKYSNDAVKGKSELLDYYRKLKKEKPNHPQCVALEMMVAKGVPNHYDYERINKQIEDVNNSVLAMNNPAAYERRRPATEQELKDLAIKTPYYAEMLLKKIDKSFSVDISTSDKLDKYIKDLADKKQKGKMSKDEGKKYEALCLLAKKGLTSNDNEDKVNHEITGIAKNYRTATKDEVFAMFDNTPFYVTLLQRELGTTWKGDHEFTSQEFKDYYEGKVIGKEPNTKKITPAEKKAIESLAMEGLTKNSTNVLATIHDIAEQYKGSVQQELGTSMQKDATLANKKKEASSRLYAKNDKAKDTPVDNVAVEKGTVDLTQLLQQGRDMC